MKVLHFILGIFSTIAIVFNLYLGIFSFVGFFIQVMLVAIFASIISYMLSNNPQKNFGSLLVRNSAIMMSIIGICISMIGSFVLYHNIRPATLSDIHMTDGSGSVVFVQMSHIASRDFYTEKNTKIQSLAASGYTILMEGVRPGTPENHAKFNAYMGFQFTETLYETIAALTGLDSQSDDILYAGVSTGSLTSVDISIDDIIGLIGESTPVVSGEIPDIETELMTAIQSTSEREKNIFRYVFRGFLNWTLKTSSGIESALMEGDQSGVFRAIIEKRNDPIVEYIRTHPGQKIAIVYGALHFNGVYEGLQRLSRDWKIVDIRESYPYK